MFRIRKVELMKVQKYITVMFVILAFISGCGKKPEPLDASDFILYNSTDTVTLESFYPEFYYSKPEIPMENNYVGEIYLGEYMYKVYQHDYEDFDLFTSNYKYDQRDGNMHNYYIMQITLKTEALQTSRGITVGSRLQDVTALYGDGIQEENRAYMDVMDVIYEYDDRTIIFRVDGEQKVVQIVLSAFQEEEDHPVSENPTYQHEYETAMQQYQEFLDGKQSVATAYGEVNLDFITIPTGEPNNRYSAAYAYFDSTGDKIPELHVKSARYYYILSCKQGELFIWKNLSPYPHYYLQNNGEFMSYRAGAGPLHDDYCCYTFDCFGEEIWSLGFSRYDSNLNKVYDESDEYFYGDDVVTKQEWEKLTEDYLDKDGRIKEEILDEIEWQTIL